MGASQKGREEQVSAILGALVLAAVPARLDTGAHSELVVKRGSEVTYKVSADVCDGSDPVQEFAFS